MPGLRRQFEVRDGEAATFGGIDFLPGETGIRLLNEILQGTGEQQVGGAQSEGEGERLGSRPHEKNGF